MKLTIFHFSDSHWSPKWIDPVTKERHEPPQNLRDFYIDYISDFEALDLTSYYGDKTLLVHTGDFAHFPSRQDNKPIPPAKEMFEDIRERHIATFDQKFRDVDDRLAVPGNHDADRDAEEDARFTCFRAALNHWKTPFDAPVVRYPIVNFGDKQIAVSLFNSVATADDPKTGKTGPAIAIKRDAMKDRLSGTDYFRIALLHHNVLPHYGQRANRDVFVNSGDFNSHLCDNNFKLVLSGHQHLGNEMLFAVPNRLGRSPLARPTLESVFLTIAAPSFLRAEKVALPGFNVVEIEIKNDSNFVTITLHKFRYDRERHPSRFETPEGIVFQLLVPRIDSGTLTLKEQVRRIEVARKVVDRFYDSDSDITRIEELMFPFSRTGHFQRVRRALQVCQQLPNNIAAFYSIAVLPPSYWWQAESSFRRLLIKNVGRAAARSKVDSLTPIFSFSFSAPLLDAIRSSRSNAGALTIAERLRDVLVEEGAKCNLGQWCESRLGWDLTNNSSISVWELEDYGKAGNSPTRGILLQSTNNEIARTIPEWDTCNAADTLEIARIAIWPPSFFDDPDAARVIELHEDCLVPLFWLNPDKLLSVANKDGKRTPRELWGYDLIYARKHKDPDDEIFAVQDRPLRFINDKEGNPVQGRDKGIADAYANDLWGPNGAPAHYRKNNTYLSAEFSVLLRRPDILFAIDAYAMRRAGVLDEVTSSLYRMYGDCDRWLGQ